MSFFEPEYVTSALDRIHRRVVLNSMLHRVVVMFFHLFQVQFTFFGAINVLQTAYYGCFSCC
jgi:hypothetical protein